MDFYSFYTGKEFEAYHYLGAHYMGGTTTFRTFAPNAVSVCLIGSFNHWTETPMQKVYDGNFWEYNISQTSPGQVYKYRIYKKDSTYIDHCDPYAFSSELRPDNASKIADTAKYTFHDRNWLNNRKNHLNQPVNIYELHFGSWKKKHDADENGFYSYAEL
ncbi:MAG: glycogen-branching enzyme, partial [Oscillospiraceae bacterium]|nr:glycogen-branching enzyme [Oscillospiraceae bacterium]